MKVAQMVVATRRSRAWTTISKTGSSVATGHTVSQETMRVDYRPPYDWAAALTFFGRRAIDDVECVEEGAYRRAVRVDDHIGTIEIRHDEHRRSLIVTAQGVPLSSVAERLRQMFDLDADVGAIGAHLALDPSIAPLVLTRQAQRVFGGWDGFEIAARSIIGQQVSVERARQLNGTLVLCRLFPTPQQVADADLSAMGMPGARIATLRAVAVAVMAEPALFHRGVSIDDTVGRLCRIRGIGDWTAHYIAMRACREPDAFPASDVGLLRGAADAAGHRPSPGELRARAESWRPWRAYAAHQLWGADPGAISTRTPPTMTARFDRKTRSVRPARQRHSG
jgi:AraC family transcriptional regulator of adaptative response / DNA-3-methyladenine glycosylase II